MKSPVSVRYSEVKGLRTASSQRILFPHQSKLTDQSGELPVLAPGSPYAQTGKWMDEEDYEVCIETVHDRDNQGEETHPTRILFSKGMTPGLLDPA